MDAAKKLEVLDWVMHLDDEAVFNKLLAIKDSPYDMNEIVAYSAVGEPLNIEQYNAEIDKGAQDMKDGRVISQEDLFKKMQSW